MRNIKSIVIMFFCINAEAFSDACQQEKFSNTINNVTDLFGNPILLEKYEEIGLSDRLYALANQVLDHENCIKKGNYQLYLYLLRLASDRGNMDAYTDLTYESYLAGLIDIDSAILQFRVAANDGNLRAKYELAKLLYEVGQTSSSEEAHKLLEDASDAGFTDAASFLAVILMDGLYETDIDEAESLSYFDLAVGAGDKSPETLYSREVLRARMSGGELDQQGLNILTQLENEGDSASALYLAFYYGGEGLLDESVEHFKTAILLGENSAYFYLGKVFEDLWKNAGNDAEKSKYSVYKSYLRIAKIYGFE